MDRYSIMLGNLIVETRKRARKTQKELASELCISKQYLSDIERGNRHPIDYFFLETLASALNVQLDYVLYLCGVMPSDIRRADADEVQAVRGFNAMRRALRLKYTVRQADEEHERALNTPPSPF